MDLDYLMKIAIDACKAAGKAILREKQGLKIWQKDDESPLTSADIAANEIMCEMLGKTDFKICSEERQLDFSERKNAPFFWLIDPLDGTKGFIRGDENYCVLLALIKHKRPILSVILRPETNEIYYSHEKSPVYKNDKILQKNDEFFIKNQKIALLSVHHPSPLNQAFVDKNDFKPLKISSGLKFIALLEGVAGVYHRFESLHSWDIAAGDFLVNQNGGFMGVFDALRLAKTENKGEKFTHQSLQALQNSQKTRALKFLIDYNAKTFLCPYFLALSRAEFMEFVNF